MVSKIGFHDRALGDLCKPYDTKPLSGATLIGDPENRFGLLAGEVQTGLDPDMKFLNGDLLPLAWLVLAILLSFPAIHAKSIGETSDWIVEYGIKK